MECFHKADSLIGLRLLEKRFLVKKLQERGVFIRSTLREVTGSPATETGRARGGWVGVYLCTRSQKRDRKRDGAGGGGVRRGICVQQRQDDSQHFCLAHMTPHEGPVDGWRWVEG